LLRGNCYFLRQLECSQRQRNKALSVLHGHTVAANLQPIEEEIEAAMSSSPKEVGLL